MKEEIEAHESILELVGNTPLVRLNKITNGFPGAYYAKLEAFNPGHSAKDRIALHIINKAEEQGVLKPGSIIVETTSGNTDRKSTSLNSSHVKISYAVFCLKKTNKNNITRKPIH